jgi:hypothetical protein
VIEDPNNLTSVQIEEIEKQSLRWATQAVFDYAPDTWDEFRNSPDDADGVAEDVTQEALTRLSGYTLDRRRLYGTVDYRRARYAILPELLTTQALFVDSKAEKSPSAGRLQINQSSIRIAFARPDGTVVDIAGALDPIIVLADQTPYLATTIFVHYHYADGDTGRTLKQILLAALPNGALETDYVASATDTIWIVGPDSPARGEAQRARLSFAKLKAKRNWRVQRITFNDAGVPSLTWED